MPSDDFLDTTTEEWRAELERLGLLCENHPGKTARELADELGLTLWAMGVRLRKLKATGRCVQATGIRIDSTGRRQRVPVYNLTVESTPKEQT